MKPASAFALLAFTLAASSTTPAQDGKAAAAPEAKRTILGRHDQSGVDGKEIILGTADLPPGTTTLKVRGEPDRVLKAGDHFFIPRGTVHSVTSAEGATAVSSWILDKGKPLAEPVK